MKEWLKQDVRINGWDFEYVENDQHLMYYSYEESVCSRPVS